jgi:orotidine-5'-phosphate decarboxylase
MFMHVARDLLSRKAAGEIGLVVGATYPDSLRAVRALSEDILLLMPGIGAQGADARGAIRDGANRQGENALASVSREVIFASSRSDYAEAAGQAASRLAGETWHRDRAG